MSKLIRLVSIEEQTVNRSNNVQYIEYFLLDCYINKNYVIKIVEDLRMLELFLGKKLPNFFPDNQKFTQLTISKGYTAEDISVVGPAELIIRKFEE